MMRYVLFIILLLLTIASVYFIWVMAKDFSSRVQFIISFLTLVSVFSAGIFTYFKYEDYRREGNYQKVIVRYLDNNIDVSNSEMSHYIMKVCTILMLYCDDKCNIGDIGQREKTYTSCVQDAQDLNASLIRLSVFDASIHLSYSNVFTTARAVLRLMLDESMTKKFVENKWNLIEPFYQFATYNLQDIGELIRRDTAIYDSPNIEVIKKSKEFKKIIERFKKFNNLFDEGKALNDNDKLAKLLYYVRDYLKDKGLPTEVKEVSAQ